MKKKDSEALQARKLITETESLLADQERSLLSSHKLCASDLAILSYLQKKGPRPVNQIAPKVGLTSGSMTSAVQRLGSRDLVATHRDEKDGRKVWVDVTKIGKQTLRQLTAERDQIFGPLFATLTDRESQLITALLKKIRKASRSKK
ncbi:MAG: MarR family winged helix-turn-helix transcriptional regulator [Roseibacillus sp.]